MKIQQFDNGVIYVEDILTNAAEFIDQIEDQDSNRTLHRVIPPWDAWYDGAPQRTADGGWHQVVVRDDTSHRGDSKHFDWDATENDQNNLWPRVHVEPDFSQAHHLADKIINLIEPDYIKGLELWAEITDNKMPEYITRNYCLRRYRTGGHMGPHIDRNTDNPANTMDWTALLYLNDNYSGGEIEFYGNHQPEELRNIDNTIVRDFMLSPKAGSIVFLPCLLAHSVLEVTQGKKYYLFNFMHTDYNTTTALGEPYHSLNSAIDRYRLTANTNTAD